MDMAFSPKSRTPSGLADKTVRLWNRATGKRRFGVGHGWMDKAVAVILSEFSTDLMVVRDKRSDD
ncbi:hypothetical protein EV644_10450 [Kribbella orskensis]|uniref:Uncharacterized protein n=1 Tax=Kribbella orskensis TaxID=2512216 RepID=A0ABY2BN69_9ACTN|nr:MULTISPECIES: hypothetical protein [Kribbella]TCN41668.1 hypothetical protein EV642_10350 [Kribbella sp. VKM Ac-2500]TCO25546.1 hypothetical protein EV644_10450 [Kribbella orskensis]